jgi:hypothetical protein
VSPQVVELDPLKITRTPMLGVFTGNEIGALLLSQIASPFAAPFPVRVLDAITVPVDSFTNWTAAERGSGTGSAIGRNPPPDSNVNRLTRACALMVGFASPTSAPTLRNQGASLSVALTSTKPVLHGVPKLLSDPPWL